MVEKEEAEVGDDFGEAAGEVAMGVLVEADVAAIGDAIEWPLAGKDEALGGEG